MSASPFSPFPPLLGVLRADLERMRARKRRLTLKSRASAALAAIREERGLSCAGLARLIGAPHSSLILWLEGGRPRAANALRVEQALGVPALWWSQEPEEGELS